MIDWEKVQWGSFAQWFSAIASTAAVIVALFKEPVMAWWRRPKLMVRASPSQPDIDKIQNSYPMPGSPAGFPPMVGYADCYFLRLWVENKGKSRAEKVQVFVAKIQQITPNGTFPLSSFLPMNLRWAFDTEKHYHAEVFADGISPGMGIHCNLARVTDPAKRKLVREDHPDAASEQTVLHLETEMKPNNNCHILAPGTYHLELLIAGANCRPTSHTVEITITGKWFDDLERMLREGSVKMKVLEENKSFLGLSRTKKLKMSN
jgi:hypothetical protein